MFEGLGFKGTGCRANSEHVRQSTSDSGLGFRVEVRQTFQVVSSSLRSWRGGLISSFGFRVSGPRQRILCQPLAPKPLAPAGKEFQRFRCRGVWGSNTRWKHATSFLGTKAPTNEARCLRVQSQRRGGMVAASGQYCQGLRRGAQPPRCYMQKHSPLRASGHPA